MLLVRLLNKQNISHPHSGDAASTMPAALNAHGFVISTVTGYFHSMNLAQPAVAVSTLLSLQPSAWPLFSLTPVSSLSTKVFAQIRHQHHG